MYMYIGLRSYCIVFIPAVLNLWSVDHRWSTIICLVIREQRLFFYFKDIHTQTHQLWHLNFKLWSATESLKSLTTADLYNCLTPLGPRTKW